MRKPYRPTLIASAAVIILLAANTARATDFTFPPGFTQQQFNRISRDAGLAISYAPAAPAEPLTFPHFNVGVEATATKISANDSAWQAVFNGNPPDFILIPELRARVGLPFHIDLGAIYAPIPYLKANLVGGEIKWAAYPGNTLLPAVALRGTYTTLLHFDQLNLQTYSADISVSKGFLMFTPYVGAGAVWISSAENSSLITLNQDHVMKLKEFVGLQIGMPIVQFTIEAAFSSVQSYTARLSVGF